ncbi:MAG: AMP-binding protein [Acidimicrobiia bacterium]|nr:AMP-binding protein [Acidimicrobiia bacterium]
MHGTGPADWIAVAAREAGDQPALIVHDGVVDYGTLDAQVDARASSLPQRDGEIVPVRMALDVPSIVDFFAHMRAGQCPLPVSPDGAIPDVRARSDAAVAIRTSGTSGVPKLAPLTLDNLDASITASKLRLSTSADDRWLACLPLHHIGGLSVLLRTFATSGAAVIAPFDEQLPSVIAATAPTIASMVPTMVRRLVRWDPEAAGTIGRILVGGARLAPDIAVEAHAAGASLLPSYGMTEASSQVATARSADWPDIAGYVGPALDGFTVSVSAPLGEVGVISIDGPAVFDGYAGEEPRSGPFVTSDVGRLERDGSLIVVGRRDDVVVSGGENVSLQAVEGAIREIDGVVDVAVVGVDDPEWGTAVCAMVVGTTQVDAISEAATSRLAGFERPKRWALVDAIPLLANGKPDLAAVRTAFDDPSGAPIG